MSAALRPILFGSVESIVSMQHAEVSAQDIPVWLIVLCPFLFFGVFAGMWCGIIWLNSYLSGWRRLAQVYPANSAPDGKKWSVFACVGFNRSISMELYTQEKGMFIMMSLFFSFGHRPLFVPWTEMHDARPALSLFSPQVRVKIGRHRPANFLLPREVLEQSEGKFLIENAVPPPLPKDSL